MEPLTEEHLDAAAALLADRHSRHLASDPLVPDDVDYRALVAAELARPGASGVAAVESGELRAYLIGCVIDDPLLGTTRIFVDTGGHAAVDGELLRDAYAALAAEWVAAGHVRHQVLVPPADALLRDAWERLSFAVQHVLAARPVEPEPAAPATGVTIREATPEDARLGAELDRLLYLHQLETPSFTGIVVPSPEEFLVEWSEDAGDDYPHFVAEVDGRVVGHALLYVRPRGDLRIPERAVDLANALTVPEARGSGVGLALTHHVFTWAYERGFRVMTIDWRVTNLLSSRFWPRRGFRPTFLRLYRSIP
jgi:GNAT superfamily N-acetyltransferase